jgi:hypothetical protein
MKNFIKLLNTRAFAIFVAILLPVGGLAWTTWNQIYPKPYISPGDPGYATLDTILADAGLTSGTILISDTQALDASSNRTLKAGLTLKVLKGGKVQIPTGRTFDILGNMEAGPYQIFSSNTTGKVTFNGGSTTASGNPTREVHLRWWGATGDGTTDDTVAIQACWTACGTSRMVIYGSPYDTYLIDATTFPCSGQPKLLDGNGCIFKAKTAGQLLISVTGADMFDLKNISIIGYNSADRSSTGFKFAGAHLRAEQVTLHYLDKAFHIYGGYWTDFNHAKFYGGVNYPFYYEKDVANNNALAQIRNVQASGVGEAGIFFDTGGPLIIENFDLEGDVVKKWLYVKDCVSVDIKGFYVECGSSGMATDYAMEFNHCGTVKFESSGELGVSTNAFKSIFRFSNATTGITLSNLFYQGAPTPLYSTDGTCSAPVVRDSNIGSISPSTPDVDPVAIYENCALSTGGHIIIPAAAVKKLDSSAVTNVVTNPEFTDAIGAKTESHCTMVRDATVGYNDTTSLKFTWDGTAQGYAKINSAVSGAPSPLNYVNIPGLSRAAACVVTFVSHGLNSGNTIIFQGITQAGWTPLNAHAYTITRIDADSFSIPVDTSGYADAFTQTGGPGKIAQRTYLVCGMYVKSDTTQKVVLQLDYAKAGYVGSGTGVTINGDGLWRYVSFLGNIDGYSDAVLRIDSLEAVPTGNLWVDHVFGYYAPNLALANMWIGAHP